MENSYEFNYYGGRADEVYGLNDYESFYYAAPQQPSYSRSELFYCQTEFIYDPVFYVIPSYQVYYPVAYSADYYVPAYSGYYMPFYYLPSYLYFVSDMYPGPVDESSLVSSSTEEFDSGSYYTANVYQVYYPVAYSADYYNLAYYEPAYSGYYMPFYYVPSYLYYVSEMYPCPVDESSLACSSAKEFDSDLYHTAFGFSEKSCEFLTDGIGEVNSTCYLYYEERPEKLNDDPNDDEENSESSNNTVAKEVVSTTPDIIENTADQLDEGGQSCTTNANLREGDDVTFLKSLSAADFRELKAEIDGTYNHLKENLYNEVTKGYTKMKEFLKNVKWKWDRCLYTIREDEKVKEAFDMEQYYFHDVIRIPKGRVKYEDPAEKYILYQMLGSLEMDDLKRFMELNYDNGKKRLYKKECIGFFKIKKQLKKLKWESSSLCRITDGKELRISKKAFVRHFIRGLRNITSEDSEDVNYLLDVLKKSVLTSADMSDEEVEEEFNEVTALDSELIMEHRQVSVFSSEKLENDVPNTADMSISKEEPLPGVPSSESVEEKIIHPPPVSMERIEEPLPDVPSSESVEEKIIHAPPVSMERIEEPLPDVPSSESVEEKIIHATPVSMESIEEPLPDVPSSESVEEKIIHAPPVSMERIEEPLPDVPSSEWVEEKIIHAPPVSMERIEEPLPDVPSSESVEEKIIHAPPVSMERIEEPLPDVPSSESVEEKIIHAPPVSMERIEEPLPDVPSSESVEENIIHHPPVIPEPTVLEAAADKCHHKKRFSSLRKFLSRICCCRKKPPS